MPVCTTCNIEKPTEAFYKRVDRPLKRTSSCKKCRKTKQQKAWIPKQQKDYKLRNYFGIYLEDYNSMLENQNHLCKICNKAETARSNTGYVKDLAVDHCHKTGKIRGLLCQSCNVGLGHFDDSLDKLESAIKYLKGRL
jgi:hypothetical protein